jgi:glycosyltransferase EpsE
MMRRTAFEAVGGYGAERWLIRAEDYHLWFKFYAKGYQALNLQEPLYSMRDDRNAQARRTLQSRINEAIVRWRGFKMLGLPWLHRLWAIRPLIIWATPSFLYNWLRRRRQAS